MFLKKNLSKRRIAYSIKVIVNAKGFKIFACCLTTQLFRKAKKSLFIATSGTFTLIEKKKNRERFEKVDGLVGPSASS